jgi:magnesium-transporting ATPase (P-type)
LPPAGLDFKSEIGYDAGALRGGGRAEEGDGIMKTPETSAEDGTSAWHALSPDEVLARLGTDPVAGLMAEEAARRLARYGPNALPEKKRRSRFRLFLRQFQSPLIYLLFLAAAIAFFMGKRGDAGVILVVVFLNAIIGALQEGRAERSMEALRRLAASMVRVVRGGREALIEARELVPGDLLLLAAGDAVGADARILDAAGLEVEEAALTGESLPVAKAPAALPAETLVADRRNMVYAGTQIAAGRGRAAVVATGHRNEVGKIAALTEAAEEPKTPLERRIEQFGRALIAGALVMFATVLALGFVRGLAFSEIFMVAVSQVVSMIPEGLPVAMTIALAVGMQRMASRGAIVRRLAAVESLGSTSVICSDKTGTLTRNEMTVTAISLPGGREIAVTGAGYAPEGELLENGRAIRPENDAGLSALLTAAALCNDAELSPPGADDPRWRPIGDATEASLLALAKKAGIDIEALRAALPRRAEIPFDPGQKMMATAHARDGSLRVFLKGAPEAILDLCASYFLGGEKKPLDRAAAIEFQAAAERMASRALRVLALAEADSLALDPAQSFAPLRGRATFLGLTGQLDPPRPEAAEAVRKCQAAGIRTVMVTGDHKATGLAIARALGIAADRDLALDGRELAALSEEALRDSIDRISVFARVHPAQKLRIVEALQARAEVVAMTGDGVNDAPALARADVGVAMGITGTEVAKEAAKIVITDDNFATIVRAVEEGRLVYKNLKKVILYLFSTSMAEIVVLMGALLLGYPLPLAAVQILWINIVTEGTITINLIMEPPEGDEMRRPPIPRGEPLLSRRLLERMAFMTPAIALSTLGYFAYHLSAGTPFSQAQTGTFTVLAVCQWFNVLNCRSERQSALRFDLFKNPWLFGGLALGNLLHAAVIFFPPLNQVFHTVPLPWSEVFTIGAAGSSVLWVEEIRKWFSRRSERPEKSQ